MMSRKTIHFLAAVIAVTLLATGCSTQAEPETASHDDTVTSTMPDSGIAVVDLDAVAVRLGRVDVINQSLLAQLAEYEATLKRQQKVAQQHYDTRKAEAGDSPTLEQQQELAQLLRVLNASYDRAKQDARSSLQELKATSIAKFKQEVAPIALEIARKNGLSIVVPKNRDFLLAFESELEITDEVVQAMGGDVTPTKGITEAAPEMVSQTSGATGSSALR